MPTMPMLILSLAPTTRPRENAALAAINVLRDEVDILVPWASGGTDHRFLWSVTLGDSITGMQDRGEVLHTFGDFAAQSRKPLPTQRAAQRAPPVAALLTRISHRLNPHPRGASVSPKNGGAETTRDHKNRGERRKAAVRGRSLIHI